ncbi:MAG TPA: rhodanese-like domain-containing protein [Chloroflexota bacterium]|nr:rhodanese-like domain-containing protein [Chloroflexota bacterium]
MPESVHRCTISQLLSDARSRIERFEPAQALAAMRNGATIIDIRGDTDRIHNGIIPGSLHIPRTVLEWRLDPDSDWRSPHIAGLDQPIILLCDHGFSSSLAASTLRDLGFQQVGDVIGGFEAWLQAGLPVGIAPPPRPACELPGMGPHDPEAPAGVPQSQQHHWDTALVRQGSTGVSWYQPIPDTSLELIETLDIRRDAAIIDIGAGASSLVDCLLTRGFSDITVLDISAVALRAVQERVPPHAPVRWLHADVLTWNPTRHYALWHDRAMFHFLVTPADRQRYLEALRAAVQPGGAVIIGVFAADGPDHCSGLPVQRYGADELASALGPTFQVIGTTRSDHRTPAGGVQPFTWLVARRQRS